VFVLLCACGQKHDHILVASNSGWYLDGAQLESIETLKSQLKNINGKSVLIASCAKTKHQLVVDTLNLVSESGIKEIGLNSAYQSEPCN
jgi:biopolymer transport protein ExbD